MKPVSLSDEKKAEIAAHLGKRPALAKHVEKFQNAIWFHLVSMRTPAKEKAARAESRRTFLAMSKAADDLYGLAWHGLWKHHWGIVSPAIVDDLDRIRRRAAEEAARLAEPKRNGRPPKVWREQMIALVDDLYRNDRNRDLAKSRDNRAGLIRMLDRFAGEPVRDLRVRRGRNS